MEHCSLGEEIEEICVLCGESWEFLENFGTGVYSLMLNNYSTGGQFGDCVLKNRMAPTHSSL